MQLLTENIGCKLKRLPTMPVIRKPVNRLQLARARGRIRKVVNSKVACILLWDKV